MTRPAASAAASSSPTGLSSTAKRISCPPRGARLPRGTGQEHRRDLRARSEMNVVLGRSRFAWSAGVVGSYTHSDTPAHGGLAEIGRGRGAWCRCPKTASREVHTGSRAESAGHQRCERRGLRGALPRARQPRPSLRWVLLRGGHSPPESTAARAAPRSCPSARNVRFYPTAAAAQSAGFRACLRCHPHAAPGSPEWNRRGDLAARAMGLIADGIVDREGVSGLARRLAYSERHLTRQLTAELGAGPLALARAQRAQTARILIETTTLRLIDVAHAAGFASVRQFNDTIRVVYGRTPTELRRKAHLRNNGSTASSNGSSALDEGGPLPLTVRLAYREPLRLGAAAGVPRHPRGAWRGGGRGGALPAHPAPATRSRRRLARARERAHRVPPASRRPARPDRSGAALPAAARPRRRSHRASGAPRRRSAARAARARRARAARAGHGGRSGAGGARRARSAGLGGRRAHGCRAPHAALGEPLAAPDGGLTHLFPTPAAIAAADPDAAARADPSADARRCRS